MPCFVHSNQTFRAILYKEDEYNRRFVRCKELSIHVLSLIVVRRLHLVSASSCIDIRSIDTFGIGSCYLFNFISWERYILGNFAFSVKLSIKSVPRFMLKFCCYIRIPLHDQTIPCSNHNLMLETSEWHMRVHSNSDYLVFYRRLSFGHRRIWWQEILMIHVIKGK